MVWSVVWYLYWMHANITASCVTELVLCFVLAVNSFACEDDVAEGKSHWYLTVYRLNLRALRVWVKVIGWVLMHCGKNYIVTVASQGLMWWQCGCDKLLKKVKVAHTRLLSIGFWSWSRFLEVSLQVTWVINLAVGCHYFLPGLQLPPKPLRGLLPILLLGAQRHDGCEHFA